jgi:hypothetical protein
LVPFGVLVVNFLGLLRLARRVLNDVGMSEDKEAKKRMGAMGASTGFKLTAIDLTSDAYQLVVGGAILSDAIAAGAAAAGGIVEGVTAAADTFTALDFALLGSMCFVTGMVSAWGAAVTRPGMVTGMGHFLAAQQLVATVNPGLQFGPQQAAAEL